MFLALLQDLLFQKYHHIYHGSDFQAFYALAIFLLMAWGLSKIDTIRRKYLDISDFKFNIIFIPSCLLFHFLTIVIYPYFLRILLFWSSDVHYHRICHLLCTTYFYKNFKNAKWLEAYFSFGNNIFYKFGLLNY